MACKVAFDDGKAVALAGIALVAMLATPLGIEALVERFVALGERVGSKVMKAGRGSALRPIFVRRRGELGYGKGCGYGHQAECRQVQETDKR